jgi:hypothetical protein
MEFEHLRESCSRGSSGFVHARAVDRWPDYTDLTGGVAGHDIAADKIYLSGGFTEPSNGYIENWTFTASWMIRKTELKVKDKPTEWRGPDGGRGPIVEVAGKHQQCEESLDYSQGSFLVRLLPLASVVAALTCAR